MDKKDIYEHLAKIYLDASSNKKRKKARPKLFKNLFFISIVFILALSGSLVFNLQKNKSLDSEIALVLVTDPAKINFHFNPAKKEFFSLNLNKLDLTKFKALAFSVKKNDYQNTISLRVEFTNAFKEKSEVYFKDIAHKWQELKINLPDFIGINDWSEMSGLTFTIEEWNTKEKMGVVFIDNVRLIR